MLNRSRGCVLLAVTASLVGGPVRGGSEDFVVETVAEGLDAPVALALAPDGRVFVTEQGGRIRVVDEDGLQATPFAEVAVHVGQESGLLGIAIDPDFSENGYVYVFATVSEREQQILRFTDEAGVGVGRMVIKGNLPTRGAIHNGGGLGFGGDGKLYFSLGDAGDPESAQDLSDLRGTVGRINADGSIPVDNPFLTPTGAPRAIFAYGFRNPFRFVFGRDGALFVLDVGSSGGARREEINLVRAGENFGWPLFEGAGADEAVLVGAVDPIFAYHDEGSAVTGAAVYRGGDLPQDYVGDLLHLEFVLNRLYRLELEGGEVVTHSVVTEVPGGPTDLIEDHDGTLLYAAYFDGAIRRVRYVGAEASSPSWEPGDGEGEGVEADDNGTPPQPVGPPSCGFGLGFPLVATLLWRLVSR